MLTRFIAFLLLSASLTLVTTNSAEAADEGPAWLTNYNDAVAQAKKDNKLVLADFTGSDWCGFCIKLKKEVLDTPEFKQWAAKDFVLLELDFPKSKVQSDEVKKQNRELKDQYHVRGYPTIILISGEGKEVGRVVGYPGKDPWTTQVREVAAKK